MSAVMLAEQRRVLTHSDKVPKCLSDQTRSITEILILPSLGEETDMVDVGDVAEAYPWNEKGHTI